MLLRTAPVEDCCGGGWDILEEEERSPVRELFVLLVLLVVATDAVDMTDSGGVAWSE